MEGSNLKNEKGFWRKAVNKTFKRDVPLIVLFFFLMGVVSLSFLYVREVVLQVILVGVCIYVAYKSYGKRTDHENERIKNKKILKLKLSPFLTEEEFGKWY